jgi:predicted ester cyclase
MTEDDARRLANAWVAAWNAHDLDAILSHYEDAVELTSPIAVRLLGNDGKVVTKSNLKAYFQRGLEAYPNLHFELHDVLWGLHSVVLYYTNQNGIHVAEFMEVSPRGKVIRVVANYGGASGAEAQVQTSDLSQR